MDEIDFKNLLNSLFLKNNVLISKDEQEKLYLYMKNLSDWNQRINLTAIKDEKEIVVKHFLDSVIIKDKIVGNKVLDIGSGAGFPGIPLKIFNENLDVVLLDAVHKKVNFMNDTIGKLELKNVVAFHGRAED